jgi:hypothetical protein
VFWFETNVCVFWFTPYLTTGVLFCISETCCIGHCESLQDSISMVEDFVMILVLCIKP